MVKKIAISALMLAAFVPAVASPLWLRNTAISPDGSKIAFTYKGDIYTVSSTGGKATRLTSMSSFDTSPLWSPDGSMIAFASDREGSLDIYVMPAEGGTPCRLTTHSGKETPLAFMGNDRLLFSASLQPARHAAQGNFQSQVYVVSVDGSSRPVMYSSIPATAMSVAADGRVLYQDRKGYENLMRKHERSSGTADVWMVSDGKYTRLTDFGGNDLNPVWDAGGQSFYYLSERSDNTLNVYRRNLADGKDTQLTHFKDHPVRSLSASTDGILAFSWDGEIYTLSPGATEPDKLHVEIVTDDYTRQLQKITRRSGAGSMAVSPDGDEVAFVVHGDVYVTSTKYGTTRRITNTPEQERTVDFSSDGRTLVYDGERDGIWQLYTATIANSEEKKFTYATEITETPLYRSDKPAFQPAFSPDGKEVAFLENRTTLRVINLKDKKVRTALDGKYNYSYTDGDVSFEWSPDSRWFLVDYIGEGGWNNKDVALVKSDGSEVHDLTQSGYSDGNAKWVLGGKAMIWDSDRNGMRSHGSWGSQSDVYIMFFDGEAYDKFMMDEEELALLEEKEKKDAEDEKAKSENESKKNKKKKDGDKDKKAEETKPLEFDLDNARYRVKRLSGNSSRIGDFALSKKGDKLFYITSFEGTGDLWVTDLKKGDTKILAKAVGYGGLSWADKTDDLYMLGSGIKKINPESGAVENVDFEARQEYRPFAEREYMFNHVWQQVKDKFYDADLHGVDWSMYGEAYRRFLPHITNNYDFSELLSEILGELNASHTGSSYYGPGASQQVAVLGAFYDEDYAGDGLKVAEVIKRGPLDTKKASVKPGDVILAVDGKTIAAGQDYFPLMEGLAGRRVRLTVRRADSGKTESVEVKPISNGAQSDLLYQRWVERNQAVVDSVSGGRVAYVHVEGMDSPSYRRVFSELLGKYRNREAVVVDTRYNGGGWLHNDIALLLGGREYVRFSPRGQYIGSEPFTQWTKPSVMLVNESNYSDAHGTPYTYQTLGLGDVVGAPVPGTMTAVWWESQIDPSIIFGIPQVTSLDVNGNVLENQQLNPDVVIYNKPEEVLRGEDAQLIGATRHLLKQLDSKKEQ